MACCGILALFIVLVYCWSIETSILLLTVDRKKLEWSLYKYNIVVGCSMQKTRKFDSALKRNVEHSFTIKAYPGLAWSSKYNFLWLLVWTHLLWGIQDRMRAWFPCCSRTLEGAWVIGYPVPEHFTDHFAWARPPSINVAYAFYFCRITSFFKNAILRIQFNIKKLRNIIVDNLQKQSRIVKAKRLWILFGTFDYSDDSIYPGIYSCS